MALLEFVLYICAADMKIPGASYNKNSERKVVTMFSFTTGKKPIQENQNGAVAYGEKPSTAEASKSPNTQEEYIKARVEEIETQRRDFMSKKPDFDMRAELENPKFADYMWKNGLSVEDAYFLAHKDEIMEEAATDALAKASARRDRIVENGAGKNSPASARKNPKDMSDKEIDSIIERVRNGEKISF